jgi:hypothetical protein
MVVVGKVSRKATEEKPSNLSLYLDNHCTQILSDNTTSELKVGLQHPGKGLDGKLWLVLVNF